MFVSSKPLAAARFELVMKVIFNVQSITQSGIVVMKTCKSGFSISGSVEFSQHIVQLCWADDSISTCLTMLRVRGSKIVYSAYLATLLDTEAAYHIYILPPAVKWSTR